MATIAQILAFKWSGVEWRIEEDCYATLVWWGQDSAPTEAAIRAFSDEVDMLIARHRMVVSPIQFRLALDAVGLLDACEAAVSAAPPSVQIAWQYAVKVERLSPLVEQFATQMEIPPEQVDAVFETAAQIGV